MFVLEEENTSVFFLLHEANKVSHLKAGDPILPSERFYLITSCRKAHNITIKKGSEKCNKRKDQRIYSRIGRVIRVHQ